MFPFSAGCLDHVGQLHENLDIVQHDTLEMDPHLGIQPSGLSFVATVASQRARDKAGLV